MFHNITVSYDNIYLFNSLTHLFLSFLHLSLMGKNVKCLCAHWHTTHASMWRAKPSVACGTGAVGGGRRLEEVGAREQLGCQTGARCTIWYGPPIFSQIFSALLSPLLNTKHNAARLAKPCVSPLLPEPNVGHGMPFRTVPRLTTPSVSPC